MIIVGSSYLAEQARRFNNNVKTLPIGLKVSDYKSENSPKSVNKVRLVWIGSKSTLSYLAGISDVLERIGEKYENAVLRIIRDGFLDFKNIAVEKRYEQLKTVLKT